MDSLELCLELHNTYFHHRYFLGNFIPYSVKLFFIIILRKTFIAVSRILRISLLVGPIFNLLVSVGLQPATCISDKRFYSP